MSTRTVGRGRERYARYWGSEFWERVNAALTDASAVLDVGGGRRPTILPEERPDGLHYTGLDVSLPELELAPPGAYDEIVAAPAEQFVPELTGRFDLAVSWQVLEHVRDMRLAAEHLRRYLRPGGTLVACLSGRYAAFAVANRLLPQGMAERFVARLRRRDPETVFPAYYDRCDERGLRAAFAEWDEVEVIPLWRGADYFERLPVARELYLRYEDLAIARGWDQLATHYVVAARAAGAGR